MNKLILTATLLAPGTVLAGGYFVPNETARDLALAESSVAAQDGAEAVLLNIAALAGPEGLNLSANGELLVNRTDWSDPTMGSASLVTTPSYPPAGAISYGEHLRNGMAWGAGVGLSVPGGAELKWPNGWPGQEAAQSISQQVVQIGIGAAFQPTPYLKLGAAYLRDQAAETLHQSINYLDHYGDAGVALSGGGNGWEVGAEVAVPGLPLTIGAQYKHTIDVSLDGRAHFTQVPSAFQPMIHDQGVSQKLTVPNEVIVGAAYELAPGLRAMAAYTFEHWSLYKNDTLVGADGFTVVVPRDYRNAHVLRFGTEWANTPFLRPLTLRLGLLRNISDQPTDTISPTLTDASVWGLCAGAGYNVTPELRVDVGYQHAFFDKVTATGMETLPGTYRSTADMVAVGINWRSDLGFLRGR